MRFCYVVGPENAVWVLEGGLRRVVRTGILGAGSAEGRAAEKVWSVYANGFIDRFE